MSTTIPIKQTAMSGNLYVQSAGPGTAGTGYTIVNNGSSYNSAWTDIQSKLKVNGDAEFDGNITVKGRSLIETLERIEERLAILVPNVRLEQDWKELQNLRQQYVELERKLLEQQRVFDILKKSD
jgi:hypothetical protein